MTSTIGDPARRAADAMNEALNAGLIGGWLAIRLSDGGTDGRVYQARGDAVRHQLHDIQCMYLAVVPFPADAADMATLLDMHRRMYDGGFYTTCPVDELEEATR